MQHPQAPCFSVVSQLIFTPPDPGVMGINPENQHRNQIWLSLRDLKKISTKNNGKTIQFCHHLVLWMKEREVDALISLHDKSSSFCCIVNYPKRGPGRELDRLGVQGQHIDRLSSDSFSGDTPTLSFPLQPRQRLAMQVAVL